MPRAAAVSAIAMLVLFCAFVAGQAAWPLFTRSRSGPTHCVGAPSYPSEPKAGSPGTPVSLAAMHLLTAADARAAQGLFKLSRHGQSTAAPAVLVVCDMEGAMGIADPELLYGSPAFAVYGRALLTREVNAALRGARDAGARTLLFSDSHYQGDNTLADRLAGPLERLPKHALEGSHPREQVERIFSQYRPEALVLVGYHVMSGGQGFLPHTFTRRDAVRLNGRELGEIELLALVAGEHGVPLVALSGEAGAVAEARRFMSSVRTAATKRLLDDGSMTLEPLERAETLVRQAVAEGVRDRHSIPPFAPAEQLALPQRWTYNLHDAATAPSQLPRGVSRSGNRLDWRADSFDEGYWTLFRVYAAFGH